MPIISDEIRGDIRGFLEQMQSPVTVDFYPHPQSPATAPMIQLLNELHELAPQIQVLEHQGSAQPMAPEIPEDVEGPIATLSTTSGLTGIRYLGFPGGHEFSTFLHLLVDLSVQRDITLSAETQEWLQKLDKPLHLEVFVTSSCPYCPKAVRLAHEMARVNPQYVVSDMVDSEAFPSMSDRYGIESVPTTIINGRSQEIGALAEEELASLIKQSV